jgi:hypothetical protein
MSAKKRRHHVVPQWYLRGFADEQKNLLEGHALTFRKSLEF